MKIYISHTHTHTFTIIRTHIHLHTCIYTYTYTYTLTYIYLHIYVTLSCIYTYIHICHHQVLLLAQFPFSFSLSICLYHPSLLPDRLECVHCPYRDDVCLGWLANTGASVLESIKEHHLYEVYLKSNEIGVTNYFNSKRWTI